MTLTAAVPVLQTERLLLRECRRDDFPPFRDMRADADVMRYIGGKPLSEEDAWTKFLRAAGHWSMMGFGYWTVEERASGQPIGEVGFGDFKRDLTPSIKGEPEIGWLLAPAAQGKGYATEAARAAIAWGDEHFSGARMSCIIEPEHTASIRVAEKLGFSKTCMTTYHDARILLMHRAITTNVAANRP